MFVRKKPNKSGKISVQVISKAKGVSRVIKTLGCSDDSKTIADLVSQGNTWVKSTKGIQELDFTNYKQELYDFIEGIESLTIIGVDKLLGKIFDEIGFNRIKDTMFRNLVLCRLVFPVSKLKTTDYLYKYHNMDIDVNSVYRYMDKFDKSQQEQVQEISYKHSFSILKEPMNIVFYDVTTLYFEIEQEDELRKAGFSKDGKHSNPQIVLGLLVSQNGYPIGYDIFEGNKYEGHTLIPIIKAFEEKYKIEKLIVVADAGMLSKENIRDLTEQGYEYILGARIKNEGQNVKDQIIELKLEDGQSTVINQQEDNNRLVINYSVSRAAKDAYNRQKGIDRLRKQIRSGKLTKKQINNRGYKKFLQIDQEVSISVNEELIKDDQKWDGLKGYKTNTHLGTDKILESYTNLWKIEKAFRISKTDLKVRPIYHRAKRRIEAHICITFAAYKVYKELERQLKEKKSALSVEKAISIAKTIQQITIVHPKSNETVSKMLILTEEQRKLARIFDF